jgi:hypothetical protein
MLPAVPTTAQVITDLSYDLAALSEPELLVDWNAVGTGTRAGIRVTTAAGEARSYTNTNLGLDNGEAFLMDGVISAESLSVDADRGARMWVRFRDATTPPFLVRHVEVRLFRETGTHRVGLFNDSLASVFASLGSLPQDWTNAADRLRVRIRHQEVAGISTIFLVAENSSLWAPDLSGPLTPDATNTFSLPVNNANFPPLSGSGEFGFGNFVAGDYYADYQHVRLMRSSEPDTVLPALVAVDVPVLGAHGIAVLVFLFAIGGWVLLARLRY